MNYLGSYKDLLEIIKINENILNDCKNNLGVITSYFIKQGAPAMYPEGTSYVDADCIHGGRKEIHEDMWQKLINEVGKLENMIYLQEEILKGLYKTKENIDRKLKGLEGLEHKVAYLKYVEGLNLQQIASKLGYSYDYIREINSKSHKNPTDKQENKD